MHELVVNLHMHTIFSDGRGTHKDIAKAALKARLDAVIVTDHNVLVNGSEGFYSEGKKACVDADCGGSPRPGAQATKKSFAGL